MSRTILPVTLLTLVLCWSDRSAHAASISLLTGDIDGDRDVDCEDTFTLIDNYSNSEATLSDGDLDADGDVDFDDAATIDTDTTFDDAFSLINNYGTGALATTIGSSPNSKMTIQYDYITGNMTMLDGYWTSADHQTSYYYFKTVRIRSAAGWLLPGVANWIGQDYTLVQNLATDQGFATATGLGDTFLFTAPYNIGNIALPSKTAAQLLADLTITYGIEGILGTMTGDIVVIPEPSTLALATLSLLGLFRLHRRTHRS